MVEVCEYYVIKDGTFTVKKGDQWSKKFRIQSAGKTNRHSVLFFRVDPYSGASNVNLRIRFSRKPTTDEFNRTYSAGQSRTEHEAIGANAMYAGQDTTITFYVHKGVGKLKISDVILFYRIDV